MKDNALKEVYIPVYEKYCSDAIIILVNSYKLKKGMMAELFSAAFSEYDDTYPDDFTELEKMLKSITIARDTYKIKNRKDYEYLIENNDVFGNPLEIGSRRHIKICFDCSDPKQEIACEYLLTLRPRNRLEFIDKVTTQHFVRIDDEDYNLQLVLKNIQTLRNMFSTSGYMTKEIGEIIDLLCIIAGTS